MDANKRNGTDEEVTIDLVEIFYLFRSKIVWILLVAIVGALVAGVFTYFLVTPKYQASSQLYIVSASNDSVVNLSDLQIGTSLTADYKELVLIRPMLESVIHNLGLDMTVKELRGMISVTNTSGTRILKITATTTDPQLSADIANEMATVAVKWLPEVMETNAPNIADYAVVPTARSSPSYSKNVIIGALIAAVAYCAFLVIRLLMNDTIVTAEDMEKYFGAMPLTTIPEEAGVTDLAEEE